MERSAHVHRWLDYACQCLIVTALMSFSALAQNNSGLTVEGVVVDSNGAPIVEAQVQIAGGAGFVATTSTRSDGRFQLHAESQKSLTLIVSATGFATYEQQVSSTSQSALQIVLMPATVSAKVTIAATRVETRTDETASSIVIVNGSKLNTTAAVTLDDALRQVPGFSLFRRS